MRTLPALEAEVVVVGGGTAGLALAYRLAVAGRDVLVLEAGPSGRLDARVQELARWPELNDSPYTRSYPVASQALANSGIVLTSAQVLGGCSSHNGCIAFDPPSWDLIEWVARGASGWGPDLCGEALARLHHQVATETAHPSNPLQAGFIAAAEAAGHPLVSFGRGDVPAGVGWNRLNVLGGRRQSSAAAYLFNCEPLPPTLRIRTNCPVRHVILDEHGRATGVETALGMVRARSEVVLAAGALESPALLLRSGVGPAEELRKLGLPVLHPLQGVGENLMDHPEGILLYEPAIPVPTRSANHIEASLFARVEPASVFPEVQVMFSTATFDATTVAGGYPTAPQTVSMHPNVTRPRSRGAVRLSSPDPAAPVVVDPRYFTDVGGYDEQMMAEGYAISRTVAAHEPFAGLVIRELAPGSGHNDPTELLAYNRRVGTTVYHPCGTCRMGAPGDLDAVVDPLLRVRGLEGLRVVDASIFPLIPSVNPNLTTLMVGERAADLMLTGPLG